MKNATITQHQVYNVYKGFIEINVKFRETIVNMTMGFNNKS